MSIIKFKKETVGASIEVDGIITSITSGVVIKPYLNLGIEIIAPGFEERYTIAGNTFYVNEVQQLAPTQNGLSAKLRDEVFPSTNSGSGGSGGGAGTVLQSSDNTLWLIGVNDSGALQTTQVASGTPGTLSLFSPDNTEWSVTVNNSGALTTTAV
jgi:hypothetical protein